MPNATTGVNTVIRSLDFEPGVTIVVGANGSGKSNLVDAVAWVLGAQGARSLIRIAARNTQAAGQVRTSARAEDQEGHRAATCSGTPRLA